MPACPKCGYKRKPWQLSQFCPKCKTNVMFYGFEDRFYEDAKKAEMSLAGVRMKVAKVKAALIGSPLAVARLVCALPVLLSLLFPFGSAAVALPVYEKTLSFGGIGLYTAFTDGAFALLSRLSGGVVIGEVSARVRLVYLLLIALVALAAVILIFTVLSFISIKKMASLLCVLSSLGIVVAALTETAVRLMPESGGLVTVRQGAAVWIVGAALLLCFVLNLVISRKGLPVVYKPGDPERAAMYELYKKKEITLAEIPFPIFQTEEERLAREQAIAETSAKLRRAQEGEDEDG